MSLTPATVWRVGHVNSPLDFTPLEMCGWSGRFDDRSREYRTLYCAAAPLTCLLEVLADLRPNLKAIQDFQELFGKDEPLPTGKVTRAFRETRVLVEARIVPADAELVDVEDLGVRRELEHAHASLLRARGFLHLDIGELRSSDREVSQTISRTLFERGASGLRFQSKLDNRSCFVLFEERALLTGTGVVYPLSEEQPSLVEACHLLGLGC